MHIFLVNDDGIGKAGIMALCREAVRQGHKVSMCAPSAQQSASSHRITLHEPIFTAPYSMDDENISAYAVSGSPADCVRLGLFQFVQEPVDVLISGINDGYNAGMAVHYSGTVSAAREGALNGLPAIAASIDSGATQEMLDHLAHFTIALAQQYIQLPIPPLTVLNVNAPTIVPALLKAPVFAPLCTASYVDTYLRRESPRAGTYFWLGQGAKTGPPLSGGDQDMLSRGHITLTSIGNPTDHSQCHAELAAACQSLVEKI